MKFFTAAFLAIIISASCTTVQRTGTISPGSRLHFIGEYSLPHNKSFKNTTVGGLSGIDYDSKSDLYYLISDDRSSINPARFYTARIFINDQGIDSVQFLSVVNLLQQNGSIYPNSKIDALHTPDPEG